MGDVDDLIVRVRLAATEAVTKIGEDLLSRATALAPIEEGTLRGSGNLDVIEERGTITARVSFNTIYAARQHEETEWNHPLGGQAKYLEAPLKQELPRYQAIIRAAVNRAVSGGK